MISRERRSFVSDWWWTVDWLQLGVTIALMLVSIILSLAASPPVATRIRLDPFHFFIRHVIFLVPSFALLIGVSFLSPRQIRRCALIVFTISIVLISAALLIGPEVKGSRRWITLMGTTFQASEAAKPAFVILTAWLFAESTNRPEIPTISMAMALLLLLISLLIMEPDFGQVMLIFWVWTAMLFIAGVRMIWILGLAAAAIGGFTGAYCLMPHVAARVQRFINPASGDTFQIDSAMRAFSRGGWFGVGPGEGIVKLSLPDSHTDFVLAVAAEEFGISFCLALVALYVFIVIRVLLRAHANTDMFSQFAASGLAILFGLQAAINILVNLQLIPAKGMTLPIVSYGGSSMVSAVYGFGMMLALTRQYATSSH